ncbi:unnamed protein product [Lampetra planeri]
MTRGRGGGGGGRGGGRSVAHAHLLGACDLSDCGRALLAEGVVPGGVSPFCGGGGLQAAAGVKLATRLC